MTVTEKNLNTVARYPSLLSILSKTVAVPKKLDCSVAIKRLFLEMKRASFSWAVCNV